MKSKLTVMPGTSCHARGRRGAGLVLAFLLVVGRVVADEVPAAAVPSGPAPAMPKTYHLYVGADIEVPKDDVFHRMRRFTNYSAEIRVDGRVERVRIEGLPTMRVGRDMKLSVDSATITGVRVERAYSGASDPFRNWAGDGLTAAAATETKAEANLNMPIPQAGPGSPGIGALGTHIRDVVVRDTFTNSGNDMTNTAQFVNRSMIEEGKEQFDAIEAEFQVSSSTHLQDCYLLMICDFKMKERDERLRRWIHLKTLEDITPKARKVRLREAGLPPGYILVAHEFHLYAGGREIATNLSDKRIELSEEEAFTFMNLQYIGAHRGETLPPAVAWAEVPPDLAERLPPDVLRWEIHVRVDAEGRVIGIAADAEGTRGAPKRVVDAIRVFRFNPALEKGKPVAGKVVLRIADFLPPLPE